MTTIKRPIISVISPVGFGMHGQVLSGILHSPYARSDAVQLHHFFTRGFSEEVIRSVVEYCLSLHTTAFITLGLTCSLVIQRVLAEKGLSIPVVFAGISDPYAYGLAEHVRDLAARNMTGITYSPYETRKAAEFLCAAKPHAKSILFVSERVTTTGAYQGLLWEKREIDTVRTACETRGIEVHYYAAQSIAEAYSYLREKSHLFDTLMILEGSAGVGFFEPVGIVCAEQKKTLFTGLIAPVRSSAALGYGASYQSMGTHAMAYAYRIVVEGTPIAQLPPYYDAKARRPAANLALAAAQGLAPEHVARVCEEFDGLVFKDVTLQGAGTE